MQIDVTINEIIQQPVISVAEEINIKSLSSPLFGRDQRGNQAAPPAQPVLVP